MSYEDVKDGIVNSTDDTLFQHKLQVQIEIERRVQKYLLKGIKPTPEEIDTYLFDSKVRAIKSFKSRTNLVVPMCHAIFKHVTCFTPSKNERQS